LIDIEAEQQGQNRADYGDNLLKILATKLKQDYGEGFSCSNLKYMRQFYLGFLYSAQVFLDSGNDLILMGDHRSLKFAKLSQPEFDRPGFPSHKEVPLLLKQFTGVDREIRDDLNRPSR
jgi:hypothetical protein